MADRNNVLVDSNNRLLYLSDDVGKETIGQINFQLVKLILEDDKQEKEKKEYERQPIHIFINSEGGNNRDMWSLVDIILNSKTPIYTYCSGYAMSAGFLIFLAGEKRFATKHATFLYHQLSAWENQTYQGLVEYRKELEEIEKFVQERTKITNEELQDIRIHKKDWYIHVDKALELNIITDLIN